MALPIALGLYSVRDLFRTDLDACLRRVAEIGYTGVEFFGEMTLPAQEVADALQRHRLTLVGWHVWHENLEGDALGRTAGYLEQLQCPRAIVPYMPPETFQSRAGVLELATRLNAMRARLAQSHIELGYHNHAAEFRPLEDGALPWAVLMDNTGIIAQLDTGNALESGTPGLNMAALVERWPGRAATVHAKPYSYEHGFATMIGEDDIDWPAFLAACEAAGGTQWLIVEYEDPSLEQFEGARRCLRALERLR